MDGRLRRWSGRAVAAAAIATAATLAAAAPPAVAEGLGCPPEINCPDPVDDLFAALGGEDPDPDPEPEPDPPGGGQPPGGDPPPGDPPPGGGQPGGGQPGGDPPPGGQPPPPAGEPGAPAEPSREAPFAVVPRQALVASRRGNARLSVTCAGDGACPGTLRVERRARGRVQVLASAPFDVPVGERARLTLRLTRAARRLLRERGRLAVVAVAITRPGTPTQRRSAARLTLRLARR